jgi:hypothetical protein
VITCHEGGLGYTVRASEEGTEHLGYEFAAFSETSRYSALGRVGRVREKAYRGLATRRVTSASGSYQMLHDEVRGASRRTVTGACSLMASHWGLRILSRSF